MVNCNNKNVLVVGAGFAGATIARKLAENDINVLVIDKRDHVAGNAFDYINNKGERIHKYGPHLLHGNNKSIALQFLNNFTEWVKYEHKVKALLNDGRFTVLPVNRKTIEDIYQRKFSSEDEVRSFLDSLRSNRINPTNSDEFFESQVGNKIADIFFRPYTRKMWGMDPKYLTVGVGSRLPVRTNYDDRYFSDSFQSLPKKGYNFLIENMLDHKKIEVKLNYEFNKDMESYYEHSFLCMPIDSYFSYKFGKLPYRSIKFENKISYENDLPASVINFTDQSKYTRMTQWNLLPNSGVSNDGSKTITYEIPCSMEENPKEYYYPVHTKESLKKYKKYCLLSKKIKHITFCGRAGLFKYIDMLPCVLIHITMTKKFLNN